METNKKLMWYHDRFFIISTEEKRIRASYLDYSIDLIDNEDISDDTENQIQNKS